MNLSRSLAIGYSFTLVLALSAGAQTPVGTAFTYQGRLADAGAPANGTYDLRFILYNAEIAGSSVGPILYREDVGVANGFFTVSLDFGGTAFTGEARWLEIGVRPGASGGAYAVISLRQELTPTPNAIYSQSASVAPWSGITDVPAGFADDVDNDSGGDITGVAAGSGLTGGGDAGDVTLSLDTVAADGRYVLKSGDTMTGTLALNPAAGVAVSTTADIDLLGRVMRGGIPFIQADTSLHNTAIGENALYYNTEGNNNTATGADALAFNTTGYYNTATGNSTLHSNTTGYANTATGSHALYSNTTGNYNTAVGMQALAYDTTGDYNTATGGFALANNTTSYYNTAIGCRALRSNTIGHGNTAMGYEALRNNTEGRYNIAVGYLAGDNATTGDYNIYIGHAGFADEGSTIRIGVGIHQNRFFAAGIRGVTTGNNNAIPVVIDSAGQLGTVSSSIRFKEDVRDMSDASAALFQLRPVTFRYKWRPAVPEERHYGLIAEEVNEVIPELVAHSADGQIESVKYHELPAMLLNELQKLRREVEELRAFKDNALARLAQLESR